MGLERITVAALLAMVGEMARTHIRNGNTTERGLALLAGVSQPHLHNVLKGARQMTPDLADRLLGELRLGVIEVLAEFADRNVPRIGPGSERPAGAQARPRASS